MPVVIDWLIMRVKHSLISLIISFTVALLIWSWPQLWEDLRLDNNYQIALFPIKKGYYIGFGLYLNGNIHIRICKIKIPRNKLEYTKLKIIYSCMNNTIVDDYPVRFQLFINAIVAKCMVHYNHKTFYYNSKLLKSIGTKNIKHKLPKKQKKGK